MTERLYYRDPALLEFEATIISSKEVNGRFQTTLDRSAFYPTSGGQLFDTGLLSNVPVIDVVESDHEVLHISERKVGDAGELVHGLVDAARRQVHRQQHTAQHILSQTAVRKFGYETVSVHLGDDYGAIELNCAAVEQSQLETLETEANQILYANWPVTIMFVSGAELESLPLRKIPSREGELRVIKVGDFDYSACGGTHVSSTAEVGLIKIIGWEKLRGHALIRFLSGVQALEDYRTRFGVTDSLAKALTCNVNDIAGRFEKLAGENREQRKQIANLFKELLPIRVEEMIASATQVGQLKLVYKAMEGMDAQTAGQLAGMVADRIDGLVLLVAEGKLLLAVSATSCLHAGELAKKIGPSLGLKGGGSNKAAQLGGAEAIRIEEYKSALVSLIGHA